MPLMRQFTFMAATQLGNLHPPAQVPVIACRAGALLTEVKLGRDNLQQLIGMPLNILLAPVAQCS